MIKNVEKAENFNRKKEKSVIYNTKHFVHQ